MKTLSILLVSLIFLMGSCDKEQESLVDTSANDLEDINNLAFFENSISSGVSVIFFHASWCEVCAEQRPAVEEASQVPAYHTVFFGEVEYEKNTNINQTYSVGSFPTIVFYKDGAESARFTGKGNSLAEIEARINAIL